MSFFSKENRKKQKETTETIQRQEQDQLRVAMMKRCVPVAKEVLKLIVEHDLTIGDTVIPHDIDGNVQKLDEKNRPEAYKDVATKIQQLMLDHDLLWMERHMVFMLVKQPMDMLQNIVLTDLETSYQHGLCKLFGIEVFGELSFKQIDEFLKKNDSTVRAT